MSAHARMVTIPWTGAGFGFNIRGPDSKPPALGSSPIPSQYVSAVEEGKEAEKAGLLPGDRILQVNGRDVVNASHDEVINLVRSTTESLKLTVASSVESLRAFNTWKARQDKAVGTDLNGDVNLNGGNGDVKSRSYSWAQTLQDLEIRIPFQVPFPVTSKHVVVEMKNHFIKAGLQGEPPVFYGHTYGQIKPNDSTWFIEDNKILVLNIEKEREEMWERLLQSESSNPELSPFAAERGSYQGGDDLACFACTELMVEPTTLQCGHSFCRHCLAANCVKSAKRECSTCRQPFVGVPQVSVTLRNAIESTAGPAYEERKRLALTPEVKAIISEFEGRPTKQAERRPLLGKHTDTITAWCKRYRTATVCVIALALFTIWSGVAWLFRGRAVVPLDSHKPMRRWTEDDVSQWLAQRGSWAEPILKEAFPDKTIDGVLLVNLTAFDIDDIATGVDDLHKRAFIVARDAAREYGSQSPADLWKYKKQHLWHVTWGASSFTTLPRLSVVYLWVFDYDGSFQPLIHSTCPVMDMQEVNLYSSQLPEPTFNQWIDFSFRWALFPYLGVCADFVWKNVWDTNVLSALWIILTCLLATVSELLLWVVLLMRSWKIKRDHVTYRIKEAVHYSFLYFTVYVVWDFIPEILLNTWFYCIFLFTGYLSVFNIIFNVKAVTVLNREQDENIRNFEINRGMQQFWQRIAQYNRQNQEEANLHRD